MPKSEVYVFGGLGVSKDSLAQSLHTFALFDPIVLDASSLIEGSWEKWAKLLILPGGADRFYVEALKDEGVEKIRLFVEKGGGFLGICAGSYFAGNYCEFAKGTPIEVCEERKLSLFNGKVKGPILAPYCYENNSGARAARLVCEFAKEAKVYYNGGGTFVSADPSMVWAYYDLEGDKPAIVACNVGEGRAILSGVHFEFDPIQMDPDHPLSAELQKGNEGRCKLVKKVFEFFDLSRKRKPGPLGPGSLNPPWEGCEAPSKLFPVLKDGVHPLTETGRLYGLYTTAKTSCRDTRACLPWGIHQGGQSCPI